MWIWSHFYDYVFTSDTIFDDGSLFVRSSEGFSGELSVSINLPEEFNIKFSLTQTKNM